MSQKTEQVTPEVGMGCTLHFWSDRRAATIIQVKNERLIVVQEDKATCTSYEAQTYTYERDPDGPRSEFSLRNNGRWVRVGEKVNGTGLGIGFRSAYHDPHF